MTELRAKAEIYKRLIEESDSKIPVWAIIVFLASLSGMMYAGIIAEVGIYILGGLLMIPLGIIMVRNPRIWIYAVALGTIQFFRDSEDGVSVIDVVTGLFFTGSIVIWLVWRLMFQRKKIIESTADKLLMTFFILLIFNLIIGLFNEVTVLDWFREFAIFVLVLYAFPIKTYFTEKKHIATLLVVMACVVFVIDFAQFYQYYKALGNMVYAYQLSTSVRTNQSLFTAGASVGIIFALYQRKFSREFLLLIFSAATIALW